MREACEDVVGGRLHAIDGCSSKHKSSGSSLLRGTPACTLIRSVSKLDHGCNCQICSRLSAHLLALAIPRPAPQRKHSKQAHAAAQPALAAFRCATAACWRAGSLPLLDGSYALAAITCYELGLVQAARCGGCSDCFQEGWLVRQRGRDLQSTSTERLSSVRLIVNMSTCCLLST